MNTVSITCYYEHDPPVEATHKCERCQIPLCLLHIQKYRIPRFDQADEIYEFCNECYGENRKQAEYYQRNPGELFKMAADTNPLFKIVGGLMIAFVIIFIIFTILSLFFIKGF